ncbi:MAG: 1-acyl-sn-glycerol-3-phosphate acyltransferase [Alphaproteobacteria bacterium]|nr:1-acyl-sn-glycerol-3-phosphate acyltransferase [Alphaproteobacteria bacterium]
MSSIRAGGILAGFFAMTLPLMPLQALFLRTSPKLARTFPNWYHSRVCRLLGIRLRIDGEIAPDAPVLIVANHTSWLDIPVLSAVAPVSFVAKKEVGGWPFVSWLAKLQRTVFVDRQKRTAAAASAREIAERLATGDKLILFAEGTSSDGNRVMPFKTSLFAAAKPGKSAQRHPRTEGAEADGTSAMDAGAAAESPAGSPVLVQTLTLAYTHLHGIPMERADRPLVGWYGDMEMGSHAWQLLKAGPIDATIRIGPPVPLADFADRKELARHSEQEIRTSLVRILRGRPPDQAIELTPNDREPVSVRTSPAGAANKAARNFT